MSRYNKGFTIVELMLAMGFVSALLLAVAMTVIQIGNTYNRGITYKSVNTAGSALANELQRSINSSVAFEVAGSQSRFINETWGGRLCLGQYSYIWNYGSAIKSESSNLNKYSDSENVIRFIKVLDSSYGYCSEPGSMISSSGAVEILDVGQSDLAMHSFSISSNDSAYDSRTGQRLYYISFRVGTNDQDALSGAYDSTICKTVSEVNANPSFCAVNQFDIVARAGNISQ